MFGFFPSGLSDKLAKKVYVKKNSRFINKERQADARCDENRDRDIARAGGNMPVNHEEGDMGGERERGGDC